MRRYIITLGSTTTVGGEVISANGGGSINGVRIALEGDAIFCPACKSQGKILCVGPRLSEKWNGIQIALENDHCMCGCATPPKLIPSQSLRSQTINEGVDAPLTSSQQSARPSNSAATPVNNPGAGDIASTPFDLHFLLEDERTGKPLAGVPYKITLASGKTLRGDSDAQGHTLVITSTSSEIATIEAPYHDHCAAETHPGGGSNACDC